MGWLTERRRRRLREAPYPAGWDDIIDRNVALARRLDESQREALRDLVQVFIAEKRFEACSELELTDEIQVTIAATACLLLLGQSHELFDDVETILVYPSTMVAPARTPGVMERGGEVAAPGPALLGQAIRGGPVILAWDRVLVDARNPARGRNVVLHEFAHKIDMHDGPVDGTPPLDDGTARRRWAEVCTAAYAALRAARDRGRDSFLDDYGATNEAEFFAVATEAYFTRARRMADELPDLHALLRDYYGVELQASAAGAVAG
jgi:Mlc titration factor MtfA (ptsG expression regulator)